MTRLIVHSWYEQSFDHTTFPPSPSVSLQIAGPDVNDWLDIDAVLLDTGADATIIPERLLSQIMAAEWDQARLRSQWGEYRVVFRYEIDLRIADRTFASILVVADDMGDEMIIGRDLLNRLRFLYDGSAQQLILVE